MRAVWTFFVVWLVATGGVARAEPLRGPRVDSVARADAGDPALQAVARRAPSHVAVQRARGGERRLPPAALPAAFSLRVPSVRALVLPRLPAGRLVTRAITAGSARGPPIA